MHLDEVVRPRAVDDHKRGDGVVRRHGGVGRVGHAGAGGPDGGVEGALVYKGPGGVEVYQPVRTADVFLPLGVEQVGPHVRHRRALVHSERVEAHVFAAGAQRALLPGPLVRVADDRQLRVREGRDAAVAL
eukprot:scaffold214173_cov31-Prasinocladus_malaysianus.AAC.2